jgi:hypothetical protein
MIRRKEDKEDKEDIFFIFLLNFILKINKRFLVAAVIKKWLP